MGDQRAEVGNGHEDDPEESDPGTTRGRFDQIEQRLDGLAKSTDHHLAQIHAAQKKQAEQFQAFSTVLTNRFGALDERLEQVSSVANMMAVRVRKLAAGDISTDQLEELQREVEVLRMAQKEAGARAATERVNTEKRFAEVHQKAAAKTSADANGSGPLAALGAEVATSLLKERLQSQHEVVVEKRAEDRDVAKEQRDEKRALRHLRVQWALQLVAAIAITAATSWLAYRFGTAAHPPPKPETPGAEHHP